MANKYAWHLHIFAEDDATRQFGNGLAMSYPKLQRFIQGFRPFKGWKKTLEALENSKLNEYSERRILVIIDFDKSEKRLEEIKNEKFVKEHNDRIFIIGSSFEIENLKKAFPKEHGLEAIGRAAGSNCSLWDNPFLTQCKNEICRLKKAIPAQYLE